MSAVLLPHALWTMDYARERALFDATDTSHDAELRGHVNGLTELFEHLTGRQLGLRQTRTQYYDGNGRHSLYLLGAPVLSLDSVSIEYEGAVATAGWNAQGLELRSDPYWGVLFRHWGKWPEGRHNLTIAYSSGWSPWEYGVGTYSSAWLPPDLHEAGLRELARAYREKDRIQEGIESRSFEGETVRYFRPGDLLPATRQTLFRYSRHVSDHGVDA